MDTTTLKGLKDQTCTDPKTGCWLWQRGKGHFGYGVFWDREMQKQERAHRRAWVLKHGPIPKNRIVLHKCDNPACIRLGHLYLGTYADNVQDMIRRNRFNPDHKGSHNSSAKLTEAQVMKIRKLVLNLSTKVLAERFKVSKMAIYMIVRRKQWKHVK